MRLRKSFVKSEGEEISISTREAQSLAQVSGEVCQGEREREAIARILKYTRI